MMPRHEAIVPKRRPTLTDHSGVAGRPSLLPPRWEPGGGQQGLSAAPPMDT